MLNSKTVNLPTDLVNRGWDRFTIDLYHDGPMLFSTDGDGNTCYYLSVIDDDYRFSNRSLSVYYSVITYLVVETTNDRVKELREGEIDLYTFFTTAEKKYILRHNNKTNSSLTRLLRSDANISRYVADPGVFLKDD